MKRLHLLLLSLLLLSGCAPGDVPFPSFQSAQTPALQATAVPVTVSLSVLPTASPSSADKVSPSPSPAPVPSNGNLLSAPLENGAYTGELLHTVTLRTFDWNKINPEGDYETTYRNTTLDFAKLGLTLTELVSDETGTTLTLSVQHPAEWDETESQNMCWFWLNLSVLLDGKATDFRVVRKSIAPGHCRDERCDAYTVTLASGSVNVHTLAAHETLTVLPYADSIVRYAETNFSRPYEGGIIYTTLNGRRHPGSIDRETLPERAITVVLAPLCAGTEPAVLPQKQPLYYTATFYKKDIDRIVADGYFDKEGEYPVYGTLENVTLDFSELTVTLDRFEVWDYGVMFTLHVHYPDSWTAEQKYYLYNALNLGRVEIDGRDLSREYRIRDFYATVGNVPRSGERYRSNAQIDSFELTDQYLYCYTSRSHADLLLNAKEIAFVPQLEHVTVVRYGGKKHALDEAPTPYQNLNHVDYIEYGKDRIEEKALRIDPKTLIIPEDER